MYLKVTRILFYFIIFYLLYLITVFFSKKKQFIIKKTNDFVQINTKKCQIRILKWRQIKKILQLLKFFITFYRSVRSRSFVWRAYLSWCIVAITAWNQKPRNMLASIGTDTRYITCHRVSRTPGYNTISAEHFSSNFHASFPIHVQRDFSFLQSRKDQWTNRAIFTFLDPIKQILCMCVAHFSRVRFIPFGVGWPVYQSDRRGGAADQAAEHNFNFNINVLIRGKFWSHRMQ